MTAMEAQALRTPTASDNFEVSATPAPLGVTATLIGTLAAAATSVSSFVTPHSREHPDEGATPGDAASAPVSTNLDDANSAHVATILGGSSQCEKKKV